MRNCPSKGIPLESLTFNQKPVIADGITAETILSIDFLEANKCVVDICNGELVFCHYC